MPVVKNTTKKTVVKEKAVKKEPASLDVAVYSQEGKEVSRIDLPAGIFDLKINLDLISQALTTQLASSRQSIAHTKDRSEVRGGGKKPWRQKGTGRSRHGSNRSPIWTGGGVTFGPRSEKNFSKKINKKMKRQALLMVLSGKLNDDEIIFLDELKLQQPKTKEAFQIIAKLNKALKKELNKGTLIVLPKKDENIFRAVKNLKKISVIGAASLNVIDLLEKRYLLMPRESVEVICQTYGKA